MDTGFSPLQSRHFPAPWTAERTEGGYRIVDANGVTVAYVYAAPNARHAVTPAPLEWDEARRIARGIARLPELLPDNKRTTGPGNVCG